MHEVYMDEQPDQECGNIHAGIAASPECKEWFQHNGSYTANGLLRFLRNLAEYISVCYYSKLFPQALTFQTARSQPMRQSLFHFHLPLLLASSG